MSFLITGAQMGNKGAQSMLYVMVSELRERFPDKKIYFATAESYDEKNYNFKKLACNSMTKRIAALEGNKRRVYYVKAFCRDLVAFFAGKKRCLWHYNDLLDIEDDLDAIIDVSGFAIGDKWSTWSHESFFDIIRFAKRKDIPVYIMPQSFGPFNYSEKQMYLKSLVKEMLEYPRIVFAREKSSYKNLVDIGLKKVSLVPDLVLQSKEINLKLVFKKNPVIKIPDISTENNVGIIPNSQCFKYGDEDKLLSLYRKIIDSLIEKKCNVYIFRHSSEDYDVCKTIYKPYENVKQVKMIDHNFSSLEYSQFISNFNYIICSRYHGIVHAYRNNVPCLVLGWADKYDEVTSLVKQYNFNFSIIDNSISSGNIITALSILNETWREQKEIINQEMVKIRKKSCFSILEEDMKKIGIGEINE